MSHKHSSFYGALKFGKQALLVSLRVSPLYVTLFVLLYDFVVVHYTQPEFGLTLAIIPVILIHALSMSYSVRMEFKMTTWLLVVYLTDIVVSLLR